MTGFTVPVIEGHLNNPNCSSQTTNLCSISYTLNCLKSSFSVYRPAAQPELVRAGLLLLPTQLLPTADPGSYEPGGGIQRAAETGGSQSIENVATHTHTHTHTQSTTR